MALQAKVALVWLRNDLRLHDNYALQAAIDWTKKQNTNTNANRGKGYLLPIYSFDPRHFGFTPLGKFPKTGLFRGKFLLESVVDLKKRLNSIGGDLLVAHGKPEEAISNVISKLQAQEYKVEVVFAQKEVTWEEVKVEEKLQKELSKSKVKLELVWGSTLIHLDDLPYTSIDTIPNIFTNWRKKVESNLKVRKPIPAPSTLPLVPISDSAFWTFVPTLQQLYGDATIKEPESDPRSVLNFKGGEGEGLNRIQHYIWQTNSLREYKETRNGLVGADYSSKFSAWLWNGCISARLIHDQIKKYEAEVVSNESTYWLVFELLWRDFFRFLAMKYGNHIFFLEGMNGGDGNGGVGGGSGGGGKYSQHQSMKWSLDMELFNKWASGQTGLPFVDANMIELQKTGWMSNRGRQNVASFFTKDLQLDWRLGAEYFESILIDYDVTSNWCNWQYVAGVGTDPRDQRYFNVIKQGIDYDPSGEFVKLWLPSLKKVHHQYIHMPFKMPMGDQHETGCVVGKDYPRPLVAVKMPSNAFQNGNNSNNKSKGNNFEPKKPKTFSIKRYN
eukprot:TRINITY_DN2999_c0_g1_i1.p1 TRINITY_DN2999_c0_g1~~TRINITY_DN2999_c0_g1_i1.p1  ORF type:complete len:556 (+),score=141.35 TRINITY_DN2999_c0_g1_i1:248-1915(+)